VDLDSLLNKDIIPVRPSLKTRMDAAVDADDPSEDDYRYLLVKEIVEKHDKFK